MRGREMLDRECPSGIDQSDVRMESIGCDEGFDQSSSRRGAGDPIKDAPRDACAWNRRTGREESRRAYVAHVSADVGEPGQHDDGVRRVGAPSTIRLHGYRVAMPGSA